jgi:hypothetical protein
MAPHALLSPSASTRWLKCPASVEESRTMVSADSVASRNGTAGHEVLNIWLTTGSPPLLGAVCANGLLVTQEMIDQARAAVDYVKAYCLGRQHTLLCEEKVEIGSVFGLEPGVCEGTADIIAMTGSELMVADFKTGYQEVIAEENTQLLLYAIGAMEDMGWMYDQVLLVIIQPSCGEPKEWVLTKSEMMKRVTEMEPKVKLALSKDAPYVPTEEGCQYCPAAGVCKALQAESLKLARAEFDTVDALMSRISPAELSEILAKADLITAAVAAAKAHALQLIQLGQVVPGWKVVEGRKNRVWKDEARAISTFRLLGYNEAEFAPPKMLSPAQAEKLLKDRKAIADLITTPPGSPVLAPEDDKRPALATMTAFDAGHLLD